MNYGHTVGHAIETVTGYKRYFHGEAVAIGMFAEAAISAEFGLIDNVQLHRIKALIESYNLPALLPDGIDLKQLSASMQLDKKTVGGDLTFILPEEIGKVTIKRGICFKELEKVFDKRV